MKYKALTIAREYGSGGAEIAAIVARGLGWKLLDKELLNQISARAKAPVDDVAAVDEQVDPWLHRITRPLWGMGADGVVPVSPVQIFDADEAARVAKLVIEEAYSAGNCVIVGRGSQCVLKDKSDVFHVFVYAPWSERVRRVQPQLAPGVDVDETLRTMEAQRLEYVRRHFSANRLDPHLYDLMVRTRNDSEAAARLILMAMESER
jgi:cytidylate kinase